MPLPREIDLLGIYMPTVTLLFLVTLAIGWGIDRVIAWFGLYTYAWHPILLRVSLFTCFYGVVALYFYQ
ncbi:hypothetical protein FHR87_002510 [Azomonas macrocytogenes]|uniref:DUF1656 domain-containing protein n=1 Tax=Azomonas macrocytogenes TaxID=69962 RepID=A0A839T4U0_AZOMA|nr:hypothetical protein [Azomonas macrocytogenes]